MNKDKIKRILTWRPGDKLVAVVFLVAFVILLIPLYRLTPFVAPWADDYSYGNFVKSFLTEEHSLSSAIDGMKYGVKTMWYCWQGTFSSIAFMCMQPAVWGEQYYMWGSVFLITILLVALVMLSKVLLHDVLGADWSSTITICAIYGSMVFVFIYLAHAAFYWFNAGVHYIGMHSFMMLLAAAWIKLLHGTGKTKSMFLMFWTLLGAILVGGANFVTTLQGMVLGISLVSLGILLKKKTTFWLLPSILVYGIALSKNLGAPGNNVRKGVFEASGIGMSAGKAILCSFKEAVIHIPEFTRLISIPILILLVPIIWRMVSKLRFSFRFPGLLLAWSFCFYATGFTPSLYSMGGPGISRTLNVVKITYQTLLVINEVYWLGWLHNKLKDKPSFLDGGAVWWLYPFMGAVMLIIFCNEPNQAGHYSSWGAYYYRHYNLANVFHQEYLERIDTIKNGGPDVVVKPYSNRPWFLHTSDLGETPDAEPNRMMAEWYGKNSISCYNQDGE